MSFAPNPRNATGLPPVARTVLFWALMVALAVVLWQMQSVSNNNTPRNQISYSDFLQQLDQNNVATATFALSQDTARVSGNLRSPAQGYRTTVPKESISDLTDRLRKQNADVEVVESTETGWASWIINLLPLILLVAFWIFMMQRMRAKQVSPQSPTNIPPSNTPL